MEWAESSGEDYIFGLGGNTVPDARVAETADNLRFHHAASNEAKLRTYRPRQHGIDREAAPSSRPIAWWIASPLEPDPSKRRSAERQYP
jgi:hypothetical protein